MGGEWVEGVLLSASVGGPLDLDLDRDSRLVLGGPRSMVEEDHFHQGEETFHNFGFVGEPTIKMMGLVCRPRCSLTRPSPHGVGAGLDAPAQRRQLVAAGLAGPHHPRPRHRERESPAGRRDGECDRGLSCATGVGVGRPGAETV